MKQIRIVGIFGALAVILGAFGAHALKDQLTPEQLSAYKTGVLYHFIHTIALLGISILMKIYTDNKYLNRAFKLIITGILCFSGSLYLLSTQDLIGFKFSILGPVTPIGGLLFILGWLNIGYSIDNNSTK